MCVYADKSDILAHTRTVFRQDLLLGLELDSAVLAPLSQHWDVRCLLPCRAFMWVLRIWTQVLVLVQ